MFPSESFIFELTEKYQLGGVLSIPLSTDEVFLSGSNLTPVAKQRKASAPAMSRGAFPVPKIRRCSLSSAEGERACRGRCGPKKKDTTVYFGRIWRIARRCRGTMSSSSVTFLTDTDQPAPTPAYHRTFLLCLDKSKVIT